MPDNPEENISADVSWWLDKDQLDSLRVELQSVSPDELDRYKQIVIAQHQKILQKYGHYLKVAYSDEEVAKRFIVTDQEGHAQLRREWATDPSLGRDSYSDHQYSAASTYPQALGHFVSTVDLWSAAPQDQKTALIANLGSEEKAKEAINLYANSAIATEELIHLYQNEENPLWFQEAGAKYYGKTLQDFPDLDNTADKATKFYTELVDKYGEAVHRLHWSGLNDDEQDLKKNILAEFTEEKQKEVFPDYVKGNNI